MGGKYLAGLCQISMDVTIHPMHMGDIPAGLHLCRLSRWNQLEEDWRAFLDSPDGGGWLAEHEGTAVGTVTFLRYGRRFSWLSMMLVHPDARRAGIGTKHGTGDGAAYNVGCLLRSHARWYGTAGSDE